MRLHWQIILLNAIRAALWGFAVQDTNSKQFWICGFVMSTILFFLFSEIDELREKINNLNT